MITNITKISEGKYLLNDAVIVSEIEFTNEHVNYKIDYDKNVIGNKAAQELGDEFIMKALVSASEKNIE